MITIRQENSPTSPRARRLLDEAYGDCRFAKTAERLREGRLPAEGLSFVAGADGRLVGTVRLWNIAAGRGGRRCCSVRWRSTGDRNRGIGRR